MRSPWISILICLALLFPGTTLATAADETSPMVVILTDGTAAAPVIETISPKPSPTQTYSTVFSGFAADLSKAQKAALERHPSVVGVYPDHHYVQPAPAPRSRNRDASTNDAIDVDQLPVGYAGVGRIVAVIDSGADSSHPAFRVSDPQTVRYSQTAMTNLMQKTGIVGKYFSAKIPFGRNYADKNNVIKETAQDSHGQHVAGIVAANPSPSQSQYARGVAPEAQLAVMRVFGDGTGVASSTYAKAMDDAVKLKVDAINLSLGSPAGEPTIEDPTVIAAFLGAKRLGIPVSVAAGNEGHWGFGTARPPILNYDFGVTSSPGMLAEGITVGAATNTLSQWESLELSGSTTRFRHSPITKSNVPDTLYSTFRQVSDCGHGDESDFTDKDLAGKATVIRMGWHTTDVLLNRAEAQGADFVVLIHYGQNLSDLNPVSAPNATVTMVTRRDGDQILATGNPSLRLSRDIVSAPNLSLAQVDYYSSWGLTASGALKPDLVAPGGNVFSSINDEAYTPNWGTSMAAPHVAGAATLALERVSRFFPTVTGAARHQLVMTLLANTARPIQSGTDSTYLSPRLQGSGMLNVSAAVNTEVTVTSGSAAKIQLGNVTGNEITLRATLKNYGSSPQTFTDRVQLSTDQVQNGRFTFQPRKLGEIAGETHVVPAKGTLDVVRTIARSQLTSPPETGYLDGFWLFENTSAPSLSLPFSGFIGDWTNLPVLEPSLYQLLPDGKSPFYLNESSKTTQSNTPGQHDFGGPNHLFTHLQTQVNGQPRVLGSAPGSKPTTPYFMDRLAISPNGDGEADFAQFFGVFYRNYTETHVSVATKDQPNNPVWESDSDVIGIKSYQNTIENRPVQTESEWRFTGRAGSPEQRLPDGEYVYTVHTKPTAPNAVPQSMSFPFMIDTVAPVIVNSRYVDGTNTFFLDEVTETGSGIRQVSVTVNGTVIEKTGDGWVLPPGTDLADAILVIQDWAYNSYSAPLSQSLVVTIFGQIVAAPSVDAGTVPDFQMVVKKADGSLANPNKLLAGETYSVQITSSDPNYQLVGENPRLVTVPESDPVVSVPIAFQKLYDTVIRIVGDGYSDPLTVSTGTTTFTRSGDTELQAKLPAGSHDLSVAPLANGWTAELTVNPIVVPAGSPASTITLTPPSAPAITQPVAGSTSASNSVSGLAAPNSQITVSIDGRTGCRVTAAADGKWTCVIAPEPTPGSHTLVARQVVGAGPGTDSDPVTFVKSNSVTRIYGPSAYETAVKLGEAGGFQVGGTVYLASGLAFQDALAAVPAATLASAPILLVPPDQLPSSVSAFLQQLRPTNVVIQGGRAAISAAVETEITKLLSQVQVSRNRGASDLETAVATAKAFDRANEVYLANDAAFADALAGGPLAGERQSPLLLVQPNQPVPSIVLDEIKRLGATSVVLLGGRRAITEAQAGQLEAAGLTVKRLSGASAIDTAIVISRQLPGRREVFLTNNVGFQDALAAGPLIPSRHGVLLLSEPKCLDPRVKARIDEIVPSQITILGGGAAMARPAMEQLRVCG